MRIVGGIYRGRVLEEFEKIGVRPTSDMTRESLFNILQMRINGSKFLDLFAGTGAIGIEALSRGAEYCVFCDNNRQSIAVINKNIQKVGAENCKVYNYDALALIDRLEGEDPFDVIFIDPPYDSDLGLTAVQKSVKILADDGIIVMESDKSFEGEIEGVTLYDNRKYGRNHLSFFKKV